MIRSIVIAATLLAGAVPAIASAETVKAGSKRIAAAAVANPATRFCVMPDRPGSMLRRKICHTRAEWQARGVDILRAPDER